MHARSKLIVPFHSPESLLKKMIYVLKIYVYFTVRGASNHDTMMDLGFWILGGLISFIICQKLVSFGETDGEEGEEELSSSNNNNDKAKICNKDPKAKKDNKQVRSPSVRWHHLK